MVKCPFCDVEKFNKTRIISETPYTLIILSNPALVKGHCLVIPKRHVENLSALNEHELKDLVKQVIKMQDVLLKKFSGCDIRQNYRPFQLQDHLKINHLHIHLQPREFEDELYEKCQVFEREIFRDLDHEELDEIKKFIMA